MSCDDGHCIQRVELAIAPTHLVFCPLLLGHIEEESLITLDSPCSIPRCEAAFCCGEKRSIFLAKRDLEIMDVFVLLYFAAKGLTLLRFRVQVDVNIQNHQFFASRVAEHLHESIVAIE